MERTPEKRNSKVVLAWILIGVGMFWLLRKLGFYFELPDFYFHFINPIRQVFHGLFGFLFSFPMILIIVGLILMAGKRSGGIVLIAVGGIFLLPRLFFVPWISFSMLFPVILVAIGISIIVKRI